MGQRPRIARRRVKIKEGGRAPRKKKERRASPAEGIGGLTREKRALPGKEAAAAV